MSVKLALPRFFDTNRDTNQVRKRVRSTRVSSTTGPRLRPSTPVETSTTTPPRCLQLDAPNARHPRPTHPRPQWRRPTRPPTRRPGPL